MAKQRNHKVPGAGNGGIVPPPEHRWPKGQSGNPDGTSSLGKSVKQWANQLDEQATSKAELRQIIESDAEQPSKRTAALRVLRSMEAPDLAVFERYLDGSKTLEE